MEVANGRTIKVALFAQTKVQIVLRTIRTAFSQYPPDRLRSKLLILSRDWASNQRQYGLVSYCIKKTSRHLVCWIKMQNLSAYSRFCCFVLSNKLIDQFTGRLHLINRANALSATPNIFPCLGIV